MKQIVGRFFSGIIYVFLIIWVFAQVFPIIYMFVTSFKTDAEIIQNPWALPQRLNFDNYINVWQGGTTQISFMRYFVNSVIVTTGTLILLTFVALLCGYALARYDFPGNKIIYNSIVLMIGIPVHALLVPVYIHMESMNLLNNFLGIILVYTTFWLPFSIIIMRSYFEGIPLEVEESARLEGSHEYQVFWHIGVPMSISAVATLIIINVVGIWSELMFASVLMMDPKVRTLSVGINLFKSGMYHSSISDLMAALSIATVPLLIIYFIFQKQIVKGFAMGAIK